MAEKQIDMEEFNFGEFLLENGFAYTNYGAHNLYELSKGDKHYAVNLLNGKMVLNASEKEIEKKDLPKKKVDATKWLKVFLS